MKAWFSIVFFLIIAGLVPTVWGETVEQTEPIKQAKPLEQVKQAMLWRVEGLQIKQAVYLFGTVHFSQAAIKQLHPNAEAAFVASDWFYTEADLSWRGQEKVKQYILRPKGGSLINSLGAGAVTAANVELKVLSPDLEVKDFENQRTWAFWTSLNYLAHCGADGVTLDMQLWRRAEKAEKNIHFLESNDDQMGGLNKLSAAEQKGLVVGFVNHLKACRNSKERVGGALYTAYLEGNEKALLAVTNQSAKSTVLSKKIKKIMLYDRNKRMASVIEQRVTQFAHKSHFFAVGVSHLIGKNSIVTHFLKQGYTVTRIQ